jgi:hypothetical protein
MNGLIKCQEQERYGVAKTQYFAACSYFHRPPLDSFIPGNQGEGRGRPGIQEFR